MSATSSAVKVAKRPARLLSTYLTTPNRLAHAFDWHKAAGKSILSMSIGKDYINLAVAPHPESTEPPQPLPSIPFQTQIINHQRVLAPAVAHELSKIMNDWNVSGLLVSWPVQEEGWVGAPAGRVLFTLDHLVNSNTGVIDARRKVVLWDQTHHENHEDEWGRDPVYAHASEKSVHYASQEQYKVPNTIAVDVWNDFCRVHWPQWCLQKYNSGKEASANGAPVDSTSWLNDSSVAYSKASST
jgi:hypothetical protein